MKNHYYEFPETMTNEECFHALGYGEDGRPYYKDMDYHHLAGISISNAKKFLKQYGGKAWTELCNEDMAVVATKEIRSGVYKDWFTEAERSKEECDALLKAWEKDQKSSPAVFMWYKDGDKYIAFDNRSQDCWVEEFTKIMDCKKYLAGAELSLCGLEDEYLYHPKSREELKALCDDEDISLADIDTSAITNMSGLFYKSNREDFDGIRFWDVSNVTNMAAMFCSSSFNEDLPYWDVSKVEDMSQMFSDSYFNGKIGYWDVSSVKDMESMFERSHFDQDISGWDTKNVVRMNFMFRRNTKFDQDLSDWDVSNVVNMSGMFEGASSFSYDLSTWNPKSCRFAAAMFSDCDNLDPALKDLRFPKECNIPRLFMGSTFEDGSKAEAPKLDIVPFLAKEFVSMCDQEKLDTTERKKVLKEIQRLFKEREGSR